MDEVPRRGAGFVVADLIAAINANRAHLSEIDGAIGDGDHGINMSKGFTARRRAAGGRRRPGWPGALGSPGRDAGDEIGGVDGAALRLLLPRHGGGARRARSSIDAAAFSRACWRRAWRPSRTSATPRSATRRCSTRWCRRATAFDAALAAGEPFAECPARAMAAAAEEGTESTRGHGRQGRPRQPAGRALAGRPRRRRHLLRPAAAVDGPIDRQGAGGVLRVFRRSAHALGGRAS